MLHLPRMFRSIENRNYRLYFFGQLVSLLGAGFSQLRRSGWCTALPVPPPL